MSVAELSSELLEQISSYTAGMKRNVSLILNTGEHKERNNLKKFLSAVAGASERLSIEERDASNMLRSPISFS